MAGAEKIKEKILEEAKQQAELVVEQARKEAEEIIEVTHTDAENTVKELLQKAQAEAIEQEKRLISVAALETRKKKLQTKQELIGLAFQKAIEKLNSLPDKAYEAILQDMIIETISCGNEEIILNQKDRGRMSADFEQKVNACLKSKGIAAQVTLSTQTRPIAGGFILKLENMEVNSSFETIIRMQRESIEAEVIKLLFQNHT